MVAHPVLRRTAVAVVTTISLLGVANGFAQSPEPPEARDPSVQRCADSASRRLAGGGFDGARAAAVTPRRADACILRWEERFSASNPKRVATMIVVPVDVELISGASRRQTTLHARCGVTDGKLLAIEIVAGGKSC